MKVILYMATTVNGFIAKENDDTSFVSKESWRNYLKAIRKSDAVILGRRTYEIMPRREFQKDCLYVTLTDKKSLRKRVPNVIFTAQRPKDVLTFLKAKGFKRISICGGGKLSASFMNENLIDEIYLDIEPVAFGEGVRLFADGSFESKLKLLQARKLSPNTLQLHYQIRK